MSEMTGREKDRRFFAAIEALAPGSELVLLERYEPEPWAKPSWCYANCLEKVSKDGGAVVYGWVFSGRWEHAHVIAAAHAVWESPEGDLIDITPRLPVPDPVPDDLLPVLKEASGHWLFLPDPKARKRPSRALPLSRNRKLVRDCRRWNRREYQERQNPEVVIKKIMKLHRDLAGEG
jgi:hypothetical protein